MRIQALKRLKQLLDANLSARVSDGMVATQIKKSDPKINKPSPTVQTTEATSFPEVIIKEVINENVKKEIELPFNNNNNSISKQFANIDEIIKQINDSIHTMRMSDFNYVYKNNGHVVLIKDISETSDNELDPINPLEARIQALQYFKAMLLVLRYSIAEKKSEGKGIAADPIISEFDSLLDEVFKSYTTYSRSNKTVDHTRWLAEEFAKTISREYSVSEDKAMQQLTMARDLGIMLTPSYSVCTYNGNVELTIPTRVPENYYKDELPDDKSTTNSEWIKSSLKLAGFKNNDNWFYRLLVKQKTNIENIGNPAPPSARWFLPSGLQERIYIQLLEEDNTAAQDSTTAVQDNSTEANGLTDKIDKGKASIPQLPLSRTSKFTQLGTLVSFDVKNKKEQLRLANKEFKTLIEQRLADAYNKYVEKYAIFLGPEFKNNKSEQTVNDFFVSYQTLLTPHHYEGNLHQFLKDNNEKFVQTTKNVMHSMVQDLKPDSEKLRSKFMQKHHLTPGSANVAKMSVNHSTSKIDEDPNDLYKVSLDQAFTKLNLTASKTNNGQLYFVHSNAPVNNRSSWLTSKVYNVDDHVRDMKLKSVGALLSKINGFDQKIINYINGADEKTIEKHIFAAADQLKSGSCVVGINSINRQLGHDIATRLLAAYHLRNLMNNTSNYKKLPKYQRNIMMAALELHVVGDQALSFAGCKSGRDRTAIFNAAEEVMLDNPDAMSDWEELDKGIMKKIKEGHSFRSMSFHVAIVKLSDVHTYFSNQLKIPLQRLINSLKLFSKKLQGYVNNEVPVTKVPESSKYIAAYKKINKTENVNYKFPDENYKESNERVYEFKNRILREKMASESTANRENNYNLKPYYKLSKPAKTKVNAPKIKVNPPTLDHSNDELLSKKELTSVDLIKVNALISSFIANIKENKLTEATHVLKAIYQNDYQDVLNQNKSAEPALEKYKRILYNSDENDFEKLVEEFKSNSEMARPSNH